MPARPAARTHACMHGRTEARARVHAHVSTWVKRVEGLQAIYLSIYRRRGPKQEKPP